MVTQSLLWLLGLDIFLFCGWQIHRATSSHHYSPPGPVLSEDSHCGASPWLRGQKQEFPML